jgi:hypothetical protein
MMNYKLYTLVDITHTGQYRAEYGKDTARWKEQNFSTVIQTLGIRANIHFDTNPAPVEVAGRVVGFDTDEIIRVWRFDFTTERESLYDSQGDPTGFLKEDFNLVPYIQGLDELMYQDYAVFTSYGATRNIVFHQKR